MNNKTVLRGLRNIGPTIADRLDTIGLNTVGDLKRIGPAKAFKLIKGAYPQVTIPVCYYLYSLQGALEGKHWNAFTGNTKIQLLREAGVKRPMRHSTSVERNASRVSSSEAAQSSRGCDLSMTQHDKARGNRPNN